MLAAAALLATVGAAGACAPNAGTTESAAGGAGALSVVEPAQGTTVSVPFTVTVQTADPLGESDTGRHHIHIFFDGNEDQYQISYTQSAQVGEAPPGAHTMTISLRNADHSDAGPRVDVPLTIGTADVPAPVPTDTATTNPNGY
jgi:hypothetical protein